MKRFLLLGSLLLVRPITVPAATCSGGANCRACSNCSSCRNCSRNGGTCSVCRPDLYDVARNIFAPAVRAPATTNPSAAPSVNTNRRVTEPRRQRQSQRKVIVPGTFSGQCVGVTDGDTITVLYGTTPVRVRLQGIDAPESRQPFGAQAKQSLSQMVFGKSVTVRSNGLDRYGRILGWVNVAHLRSVTVNVNLAQVRSGMAWWYRQYASNELHLGDAENEARDDRRGLWSDTNPVAPWNWRRGRR